LLELPYRGDEGHAWNFFAPLLALDKITLSRKQVMDQLQAQGIGTGISYEAVHLTQEYRKLGYQAGDFPHAERIAAQTLTLPLYPTLDVAAVDRVCDTLLSVLESAKVAGA
jgi:dTDP-4-amino-4,6-dideoxygalactose transaminase